jgi:DNA-binding transcriptional LysR family regulator
VVPLVAEFLALYPEIDIRLTLADRVVHLTEEHVDVAVRVGALPDSALVASRVGTIRRVVCASPAYLAANGTPRHPGDLTQHQCITFEGLASAASWTFQSGQGPIAVPVRTRLVVNTAEGAIAAAMSGLGLTNVLSYQVAQAVHGGSLTLLLEEFEPEAWPISLVHAGQAPLPLKLRAFLDFMTPRLRSRLADDATAGSKKKARLGRA